MNKYIERLYGGNELEQLTAQLAELDAEIAELKRFIRMGEMQVAYLLEERAAHELALSKMRDALHKWNIACYPPLHLIDEVNSAVSIQPTTAHLDAYVEAKLAERMGEPVGEVFMGCLSFSDDEAVAEQQRIDLNNLPNGTNLYTPKETK